MNKFYYADNLVSDELKTGLLPWEFKLVEQISKQIRMVKEDRQDWYKSVSTKHYFYTGIEPLNPNLRISKEQNPPHTIYALAADFDANVPDERINEAIAAMKIKPAWVERSLGGNFRLIWILELPLKVESYDFCVFVLQQAVKWLSLQRLPELDEAAFTTPTRLYCNGCEWRETGHGPVKARDVQSFFVECGKKFRFNAPDDAQVPLDLVEKALKEKYSGFSWPGPFELESQGPSFWVEGSTSSNSAIVKPGGMFTFAAHAGKPFHSWSDILGAEFVKGFADEAIAKATANIYFDKLSYWRPLPTTGIYISMDKEELNLHLRVDCRLSSKPGQDGLSMVDKARAHINNHNRIEGAAPFVFMRMGPLEFQGEKRLNIYSGKPVQPAAGTQKFGPQGNCPVLSAFINTLFNPAEQLNWMLTWFQIYYQSALDFKPTPGQYFSLSAIQDSGKTFFNRHIVGRAVGGFADASSFLVDGGQFNSHLMKWGHWCLDDDAPNGSYGGKLRTSAMLKKLVGNQEFTYHQKFQIPSVVPWMGRLGITTNLDFTSIRILGALDNSALDKTCIFKGPEELKDKFPFPPRAEMEKILDRELPYFLRCVLDFPWPDCVERDSRYGMKPHHNADLINRTRQVSGVSTFTDILIDTLRMYFESNPDEKDFRGPAHHIYQMVHLSPGNEKLLSGIKAEQVSRMLEQVHTEKLIPCHIEESGTRRVWVFPRPEAPAPLPVANVEPQTGEMANPFVK